MPRRRRSSPRFCARRLSTTSSCGTSRAAGLPVPAACVDRDWSQPYVRNPDLVARLQDDLRRSRRVVGRLRDGREAGRCRGGVPALALSPPEDRRAHHRAQDRDRRFVGRRVPEARARASVLPGADRRAHGDRRADEHAVRRGDAHRGGRRGDGRGSADRGGDPRTRGAALCAGRGGATRSRLSRQSFARPAARRDGRRRARGPRRVVHASGRRLGRLERRDRGVAFPARRG